MLNSRRDVRFECPSVQWQDNWTIDHPTVRHSHNSHSQTQTLFSYFIYGCLTSHVLFLATEFEYLNTGNTHFTTPHVVHKSFFSPTLFSMFYLPTSLCLWYPHCSMQCLPPPTCCPLWGNLDSFIWLPWWECSMQPPLQPCSDLDTPLSTTYSLWGSLKQSSGCHDFAQ